MDFGTYLQRRGWSGLQKNGSKLYVSSLPHHTVIERQGKMQTAEIFFGRISYLGPAWQQTREQSGLREPFSII